MSRRQTIGALVSVWISASVIGILLLRPKKSPPTEEKPPIKVEHIEPIIGVIHDAPIDWITPQAYLNVRGLDGWLLKMGATDRGKAQTMACDINTNNCYWIQKILMKTTKRGS